MAYTPSKEVGRAIKIDSSHKYKHFLSIALVLKAICKRQSRDLKI